MNKTIKVINSDEATIQLKRAEFQKNILIKNIYNEYDSYFQIVRKSIVSSAEKGIFGLYSDLSISEDRLNPQELNNFLKKNISLLIYSKLPLITIEQLRLGEISNPHRQIFNLNSLRELVEFKEFQEINSDKENQLIMREPIEFHSNNHSNIYEYYENLIDDQKSSINLDKYDYFNSFSKQNDFKEFEYEKNILNSVLEMLEETNDNNLNDFEKINEHLSDDFISSDNLDFFELIDKSFNQFLLNLSYKINSELFKVNLIKKIISEETFIFLSNNNYIIKHPYPFVIRYDLNPNKFSKINNKYSNISLFNITNVELEFYNLDLSSCRNNIKELTNRFKLLNKKQLYWKNKQLNLNNSN